MRGFTLIELLAGIVIVAVLAVILVPAADGMRRNAWQAVSTHSLRELGGAGGNYRADHDGQFWKYREDLPDGRQWWFGFEPKPYGAEGERILDLNRGPLGAAIAAGGVKNDPAFSHSGPTHKPKFKNGNYGYGYNTLLGGGALGNGPLANAVQFEKPSRLVVFATCAQVNGFQPPATPSKPMLEEFYMINDREVTVHFRHGGKALVSMLDGSVQALSPDPATINSQMPEAMVGRFAPVGSKLWLWE
jgi:prepilin-type N-terminal cleavage/methylation domain-containing protein/prepilin-type processing-associated H-X9-DG protein